MVAGNHSGNVGGHRGGNLRQGQAQLGEALLDGGRRARA